MIWCFGVEISNDYKNVLLGPYADFKTIQVIDKQSIDRIWIDSFLAPQQNNSYKEDNPLDIILTNSNILAHTTQNSQFSSTITSTPNKTPKRSFSDSSSLKSPNFLLSAVNIISKENAPKENKNTFPLKLVVQIRYKIGQRN